MNRKTQAAAEHKATTTKVDREIIAIMPPLSPLLCLLLGTSTPKGFIALALLSLPGYGPASITSASEEGGDGGKPIHIDKSYLYYKTYTYKEREPGINIHLDIAHIVLHNPQSRMLL